MFSCGPR